MAVLTSTQAMQYASQAGFTGIPQLTIVAIAQAESGFNTTIRGAQDPRDRGILQINSFWHPEVSDTCAFDPSCAFKAAYRISQGTNFNQWTTYKNGNYKQYLGNPQPAPAQISSQQPSTGSPILDTVKQWGEYIAIFAIAVVLVVVGAFLLTGKSIAAGVRGAS